MIEQNQILAINAALDAGREIIKVYTSGDFEAEAKDDNSPLTLADRKAHLAIMDALRASNLPVLSEEGKHLNHDKRIKWNQFWLVDPLDGTKEFIKRNGEFTVNIALVNGQSPVFGVIYVPVSKELYFGGKGMGAYKLEGIDHTQKAHDLEMLKHAAQSLPATETRPFTVVASRSHLNQDTSEYIDQLRAKYPDLEMVSAGSALKICLVAEGLADEYPRFAPTMEWDTGAGHAIVEGAGGSLTLPDGKTDLVYNKADLLNPHFLVSRNGN